MNITINPGPFVFQIGDTPEGVEPEFRDVTLTEEGEWWFVRATIVLGASRRSVEVSGSIAKLDRARRLVDAMRNGDVSVSS